MHHFNKYCILFVLSLSACGGGSSGTVGGTSTSVETGVIAAVEFGPVVRSSRGNGYDTLALAWPSEGATMRGTLWLPNAQGQYPAVILHFGSNEWDRFDIRFGLLEPWLLQGIAVLVYDKRGVGESGGECCPFTDPDYFSLLASDLISGISALKVYPEIDPLRIGLYGFSQGGWVVPNAAAHSPSVAFTVIGSGPTVSLDEELLYSRITGDNVCQRSSLTDAEIDRQMAAAVPGRFDPRSDLEMYTVPGFWFYGDRDTSVPFRQSISILEDLRIRLEKDFTYIVFPGANHSLVRNGAICETNGPSEDFFTPLFEWLNPILYGS